MSEENRMACALLIKNARVFDGSAVREGLSFVGIADNKISFVGGSAVSASREIDAAGRFLMPGLIDCHIHLLNMWTANDETTMAADIESELPKRLNDFLTAGVTTVKSVGDSEEDILRVREMLASGDIAGPRLFATGAAFAAPGSHPATTIYGQNPDFTFVSVAGSAIMNNGTVSAADRARGGAAPSREEGGRDQDRSSGRLQTWRTIFL